MATSVVSPATERSAGAHGGSSSGASPGECLQRTGAQILCDALEQEGVDVLFGYPGGAIMPFYDALSDSSLRHVLVRHEQAAAHAADGYARATGRVGVCVATSGPGATNVVTGLATAFMDSVPIVAITGQVARRFIGTDAFQETDVIGVTQPVTKHSILVRSIEDLAEAVHAAFAIARSGRPGPVVIDVPKDIQQAKTSVPTRFTPKPPRRPILTADLPVAAQRAAALVNSARRPLILAGHGVVLSEAYDELRTLAERAAIPVVTTLLGISAFPESHPLALGMPGMHGPAEINRAIHASDVLVAVGMRFDDRVTGEVTQFAPEARIIHIDIDPSEMGKVFPPTVPIVADARVALAALTDHVTPGRHQDWLATIAHWREEAVRAATGENANATRTAPDALPEPRGILAAIREATDGRALMVTDVGQHQMWAARFYGYDRPNSHLTSGGLGTMGFALPAAMGAAFSGRDEPIWVVAGDGGFQMNIQELATVADHDLPIKIAILNNGYLGMVRQWQEFFFQRNYSETRISSPDYVRLAEAYRIAAFRVTRASEVQEAVERAQSVAGPAIVEFVIEQEANVFPMVAPGKGNFEMIEQAPRAGGSHG
ncbi:MAG TPA: biosynthetic-type acetolactate synthase large subunit [Ktedonobacterales bacterium]|nr:biosynthetic-type acetolactate synthase large subunit [Ktedonobacterales bacterium]